MVDTSAHLAAREHAIALHRSQASPFDGLPDDLKRAFLTSDRLIRVKPTWIGGPLERDIFVEP